MFLRFYGALLGIVKPFLAILNFPPDFLLTVIGKSGSLKTSLVRRYALWLDTPEIQEETFQSCHRMSDILSQINHMQGLNFLMDDLHNVYGSQAKNRQSDRLDKLARHICTNPTCANVIITGENMTNIAIFSAYDRMFQVTVPQISSDILQDMKKKINTKLPDTYMAELAAKFTKTLMSNYSKVLTDIRTFMNQYSKFGFEQPDTRIGRHIQVLRLVEFLYRTYMCDADEGLSCKNEFEESLRKNSLRDAGLLDTDTDALTKKKLRRRHYKINCTILKNLYEAIPDVY